MIAPDIFAPRGPAEAVEEGRVFMPKLDADGLIVCVVADATSGDVLMVAHMNADAIARTIESREAWFFSRSRQALWKKGESSGHTLRVVALMTDCDQDALLMKVEQAEAGACHTGRASCFYRAIKLGQKAGVATALDFAQAERLFDPAAVYGAKGKPAG